MKYFSKLEHTLLTTVNSPAKTLRLYILVVNGSVLSLFPIICAVEAVGIGASNKEFLAPYCAIFARNCVQFQRESGVATFHISG